MLPPTNPIHLSKCLIGKMKNEVQQKLEVVRRILDGKGSPKYVLDEKVQEFMEENDITIDEMAALAGVSRSVVVNTADKNHQNMHVTNAYKLVNAMGGESIEDVAFKFGEEEQEEEEPEEEEKKKEEASSGKYLTELSEAQAKVLMAFRKYISEKGESPTIAELAAMLGYETENGPWAHVRALEKEGYLRKVTNDPSRGGEYDLTMKAYE